jgi:hypothetical protein
MHFDPMNKLGCTGMNTGSTSASEGFRRVVTPFLPLCTSSRKRIRHAMKCSCKLAKNISTHSRDVCLWSRPYIPVSVGLFVVINAKVVKKVSDSSCNDCQ